MSDVTTANRTPWIVFSDNPVGRIVCLRCDEGYTPAYPLPANMLMVIADEFTSTHENCQEKAETNETEDR